MNNIDWNDLSFLLAVSRSGSAAGAARMLNVSHATVLRRIQAFEQAIGVPLFDRLQTGYVPTEAGKRFVDIGEMFEHTLISTKREIEGENLNETGVIRFTTTDSLAFDLMPSILSGFHQHYPGITVEMKVTNERLDIEKREADVALRPTKEPPELWVGRKLSSFSWGLYAAPTYLENRSISNLAELDWLAPDGALTQGEASKWLKRRIGPEKIAASADSFVILRSLAEQGLGCTVLPKFMADQSNLARLGKRTLDFSSDLWILTHPHLRYAGRIHAFMEYVAQAVRAKFSRNIEDNPS